MPNWSIFIGSSISKSFPISQIENVYRYYHKWCWWTLDHHHLHRGRGRVAAPLVVVITAIDAADVVPCMVGYHNHVYQLSDPAPDLVTPCLLQRAIQADRHVGAPNALRLGRLVELKLFYHILCKMKCKSKPFFKNSCKFQNELRQVRSILYVVDDCVDD